MKDVKTDGVEVKRTNSSKQGVIVNFMGDLRLTMSAKGLVMVIIECRT